MVANGRSGGAAPPSPYVILSGGMAVDARSKKRIVIAPDSFKGTMTAIEVCRIIRKAFLQVDSALEICCLPMADGGEGTVDAFLSALGGERKTVRVHGPLFAMHNASFGI